MRGAGRDAQPGASPTVSLCMIVKDEEAVLDRCLRSAAGAVDEVVVVDTGSTDATVDIARRHGARIVEYAWTDHFADARNAGLAVATGDWILVLDADEQLVDRELLRELTRQTWCEAVRCAVHHRVGDAREGRVTVSESIRLFRNNPRYRYAGRVHETVSASLPPERVARVPLRIDHDGFLHDVRAAKDKRRRNLALLERQLAEEGESHFLLYNLGSEYAASLDPGAAEHAVRHLARAWRLLLAEDDGPARPFAPTLALRYAASLRRAGRPDAALALATEALAHFDGFTDLLLEQARAARDTGDGERAEALLRRCLALGDAAGRYPGSIGAGSHVAAVELAALLLARGAGADEAVATVAAYDPPPHARFDLAAALLDTGHAAAAEAQLRTILAADPGDDAARVALAEALMLQSRWDEAAAAAARVPAGAYCAAQAATTHAFAAIVAGDAAAAATALARPELPAGERALLAAWAGAAGLAPQPVRAELPAASFGLLLTALEALVRVQDFDAFAVLLPLAERVDVPLRERQEQLAAMYLRRGFLDSAAEEWAAACEAAGPDARALTGLAQVAAARGALDDARVFAEAAVELDPAAAEAGRLLTALAAA